MKNKLSLFTFGGLFLGVIFGLLLPQYTPNIAFIGTIYITCLKYLVVPIVFTSITVSVYNSTKLKNRLIGKTLLTFALMFIATFIVTSIMVTIINPADNFVLPNAKWTGQTTQIGIANIIINLFPKDLNKFLTGSNLFFTIALAALIGFICTHINMGEKTIDKVTYARDFFTKILDYIMWLSPIAVFSLISNTIANYGAIVIGLGAKYIATAYISTFIVLIVVMVLPILLICKMSPKTFLKKVYKIWLITLSTCSSAATLPYTIKVCREEFNIPEEVTDVVVPLGTTIHMCGGAVSFALLGLFCSKLFGVEITITKYLMMLVFAMLINIAAPGIPNGGVVIGATYLQLLGIPLDFIGFYSGIYKLLDMVYTSLNVTDDIASNVIINHFSKES